MGMGQEMMEDAMMDAFVEDMEREQAARRLQTTAATRLAFILHEIGVLTDYHLNTFLYPSEAEVERAEREED